MSSSSIPEPNPGSEANPGPARSRWRRAWLFLLTIPLAFGAVCCWLTEPLVDKGAKEAPGAPPTRALATAPSVPGAVAVAVEEPLARTFPDWPENPLEGEAAKQLLLDTSLTVQERLATVAGYTATFKKRERIKGVLGSEQTLAMKIRHRPFAVYFKFLTPEQGKEIVYAEGHHENKIIAHSGGLARFLIPRLAVRPDHPLALADSRHAITEVGLSSLTDKLVGYRRLDIGDADARTRIDRTLDDRGRPRFRSLHEHSRFDSRRPFARVEVLYDPETRLPLQIRNYDWPEPGKTGELLLAESYTYDDLDLGAVLTDEDFDPANPAYAFHRY